MAEARLVSKSLGCGDPLFLNFPDGDIRGHTDQVLQSLAGLLAGLNADMLLAPSPVDFHTDHIALANISMRLRERIGGPRLAFYEIYTTQRFNCLVEITGVIATKKAAIMGYGRSLYGKPGVYVHAALGLNAQRSIFTQKEGYYEAFYLPAEDETPDTVLDYLTYRV